MSYAMSYTENVIHLKQTAEDIVETLKYAGFNNIQDSSGYFAIKEVEGFDFDRAVDVSKVKDDGKEYYGVYCSYENGDSDWKCSDNLSVESLLKILQEFYDSQLVTA